jgi:DNA-binding IclR family transcriptional regulator
MSDISLPVPAAARTVRFLELLLAHPLGISSQACIDHLDISRSSFFALLSTLKALGYVEQPQTRGLYHPGPRLLAWRSPGRNDPQDLLSAFYQEAPPHTIDETLALAILSPPDILILAQRESFQRVRSSFESGQRLPPEGCAAGPLLSSSPDKDIRSTGYQICAGGDSLELALPICEDGHHPIAALLLSAPNYRHTPESLHSYLPELRSMAARLSYRMGAPVYAPYGGPPLSEIEPSLALSSDEIHSFLQGPWAASLACIRPDGTPHVIPVWHEWDGEAFCVAAWSGSRWADYLLENPHVSLTVDEPWLPLRRVSAQGIASPLQEGDVSGGVSAILNRLSHRYLGQPLNPALAARPWRAFRIYPEQLRGWRGLRTAET